MVWGNFLSFALYELRTCVCVCVRARVCVYVYVCVCVYRSPAATRFAEGGVQVCDGGCRVEEKARRL